VSLLIKKPANMINGIRIGAARAEPISMLDEAADIK